jgi:hypothetical protein
MGSLIFALPLPLGLGALRAIVHGDDLIGKCRGVHDHVRGLIMWPRGGRKGL